MRKTVLTLLVLVGLLYVAGCGGGDPFVGSWRDAEGSGDTRLVIAKASDGYRVAMVADGYSSGALLLTRDGDTLSGSWPVMEPDGTTTGIVITMKVVRDSDRLLLTDGVLHDFPLTKASGETTIPSPSTQQ